MTKIPGSATAGKHPVLLFLRGDGDANGMPTKQLVGFQTVSLDANAEATLEFQVNPCEDFGRANEEGLMVMESGTHHLVVGDQEYAINTCI